ncbi:MAG: hypothetical protein FJY56_09250 [Betaproteobacteria bacterium]|nr:hypothetical protein [Betaproteobacteria bacterium]
MRPAAPPISPRACWRGKPQVIWGQPVVIANCSGAGRFIANPMLAKTAPECYTILQIAASKVLVRRA